MNEINSDLNESLLEDKFINEQIEKNLSLIEQEGFWSVYEILKKIPKDKIKEMETNNISYRDDDIIIYLKMNEPILLTKNKFIYFKRTPLFGSRKAPIVFNISEIGSVIISIYDDLYINGTLLNIKELPKEKLIALSDLIRLLSLLNRKLPIQGGINDSKYFELAKNIENNDKYNIIKKKFELEWNKKRSARHLIDYLDKIIRKGGKVTKPKYPFIIEKAEFWRSLIYLSCAENVKITSNVVQRSAITSTSSFSPPASWHESARFAIDAACNAWLNTNSSGTNIVRQILYRAYKQLFITIEDAKKDPKFEETKQNIYGSGLPFDPAYYTSASNIALESKLSFDNIVSSIYSIEGYERFSNWISSL